MRLARTFAILVVGLPCACSLLNATDGLSSGASDDGASDDDASAPTPTSGAEAGADGSSDAGSWCATHAPDATFCADFDERATDLFDQQVLQNGTLGIDALASRSPPASFWAASGEGGDRVESFIQKDFARKPTTARVAFDLRIDAAHETASAELAQLSFVDGAREYTVGFGVTGGARGAYAYEFAREPHLYEDRLTSSAIPLGTWLRITLTADLVTKKVSLERDDAPGPVTSELTPPLSGALNLRIGVAFTTIGLNAWKIRMDNVVLDAN